MAEYPVPPWNQIIIILKGKNGLAMRICAQKAENLHGTPPFNVARAAEVLYSVRQWIVPLQYLYGVGKYSGVL